MKTETQNNINSNILRIFDEEIIPFLPKHYVKKVQEILPGTKDGSVRTVKSRKSGDIKIINALRQVARENKSLLNP